MNLQNARKESTMMTAKPAMYGTAQNWESFVLLCQRQAYKTLTAPKSCDGFLACTSNNVKPSPGTWAKIMLIPEEGKDLTNPQSDSPISLLSTKDKDLNYNINKKTQCGLG